MSFTNPVTGGQGALIRPAIKSPNFVHNVSGWSINRDGSAEFNNVLVRGTITASTFQGTDFTVNQQGVFVYDGSPAAGNLIASIAAAAGTDAFGNTYIDGVTSYDDTSIPTHNFANLSEGAVLLGTGTDVISAATWFLNGANDYSTLTDSLASISTANTDKLEVLQQSGTASAATGSATAPRMGITDRGGTSSADFYLSGSAVHTDLTGNAQTWQLPGYATNWSGSTTMGTLTPVQTLRYRIDAEDNLVIGGCFAAGATPPGAAVFTLPAAYRPATAYCIPLGKNAAGTVTWTGCYVSPAGNLNINAQLGSSVTASATYIIPETAIPLGHLS